MNSIIITSIICISIIIIIGMICYTSYKSDENTKSNIFNKNVKHTIVQYDNLLKEINNIKTDINTIYTSIDFINQRLNTKING